MTLEAFVDQHICTTDMVYNTREAPQFLNLTIENSKFKIISILHTYHHTEESIAIIIHFEETIQSNTSPLKKKKKKLNSSETNRYLRHENNLS